MRRVILFIIFSVYLFGGISNYYEPKELKQYATTNWENIDNSELKQKAIKDFKVYIPKLLAVVKKPIIHSEIFKRSIKLHSEDYNFIFLYIRYLESKNRIDEVVSIYQKLYKSISSLNSKDTLILDTMYALLINDLTNKSLKKSIDDNALDKKSLKKIANTFKSSAVFNKEALFRAIENDYSIPVEYYQDENNYKEILKQLKNRGIDLELFNYEIDNFKLFVDEECSRMSDDAINILQNNNPNSAESKLSSYFKSIKNSIISKKTALKISQIKDKGLGNIIQEDKEYIYQTNAKFVCYYSILTDSISDLNINTIKLIEKNRALLKILNDKTK